MVVGQEAQPVSRPKSDTQTTAAPVAERTAVPSSAVTAPTGNGTSAASGNESATSVSTNNTATSAISTNVPDGFKGSNNGELISYLERKIAENQPLSEADLAKLRRRQKAEGIISGISDAVQSVANLVFTSQYAPNMYNAKEGMSAKAKERFDKEKAEREAADDRWFNYALNLGKLKNADDEKAYQRGRNAVNDAYKAAAETRAQAKADRDAALAQLRMDLMQGKIDQQGAAAEAKRIEADYAEAFWQSRINKNNYRRPIGSGNRQPGEYPWYDSEGGIHYAHSYEAMRQNAINNGTWSEETQQSSSTRTTTDRRGRTKGTTSLTTTKPAKGHSDRPPQQSQQTQQQSQDKRTTNVKWKK